VDEAAKRTGRTGKDVIVVAVSKYAEMDDVNELLQLGHVDFGEGRAQQLIQRAALTRELADRQRELGDQDAPAPEPRWHMIGHLQRNKVKKLVGLARLIHSVDSMRLAEEIQSAAEERDEVVDVLVQVNTSGEKSKYGLPVAAAPHVVDQIGTMVQLRVRGLMTMAPHTEDTDIVRLTFERCRDLFEEIRAKGKAGPQFNILSMGMSNDFELAIECGANMVRVGSAIFGGHEADDHQHEEP